MNSRDAGVAAVAKDPRFEPDAVAVGSLGPAQDRRVIATSAGRCMNRFDKRQERFLASRSMSTGVGKNSIGGSPAMYRFRCKQTSFQALVKLRPCCRMNASTSALLSRSKNGIDWIKEARPRNRRRWLLLPRTARRTLAAVPRRESRESTVVLLG